MHSVRAYRSQTRTGRFLIFIGDSEMKLITKIRKADFLKKSEIFQDADLSRAEAKELVREMILSLPGYYSIHRRGLGENLVDKVFEVYGWMPSMFVSEEMLLGMQALDEKRVYASFTLGLDAVRIKEKGRRK